jgi:hypothetical protein
MTPELREAIEEVCRIPRLEARPETGYFVVFGPGFKQLPKYTQDELAGMLLAACARLERQMDLYDYREHAAGHSEVRSGDINSRHSRNDEPSQAVKP